VEHGGRALADEPVALPGHALTLVARVSAAADNGIIAKRRRPNPSDPVPGDAPRAGRSPQGHGQPMKDSNPRIREREGRHSA
jgi:hypothetical protein